MATTRYNSNDFRRQLGSPRPKGRGTSLPRSSRPASPAFLPAVYLPASPSAAQWLWTGRRKRCQGAPCLLDTEMLEHTRTHQTNRPTLCPADTKDTLCRNILIYGHCRYEDTGCAFSHDQSKKSPKPDTPPRLSTYAPGFACLERLAPDGRPACRRWAALHAHDHAHVTSILIRAERGSASPQTWTTASTTDIYTPLPSFSRQQPYDLPKYS
ncbi:hypothetical protein MAPG_10358 [Magnaporthiopsis poae ATCC 64411]|uniref:C3H1-type domain-containing protein n=1 Tax=Magnaporthiopsis poae (strain ATCC 64411 / 73-15) TaxID=644358 RepID=A0A0C4ECD8_MAGP6|nr:hypothetical protein MAPG_10358 [Magnaporthiopsis poae ATCC 64411]